MANDDAIYRGFGQPAARDVAKMIEAVILDMAMRHQAAVDELKTRIAIRDKAVEWLKSALEARPAPDYAVDTTENDRETSEIPDIELGPGEIGPNVAVIDGKIVNLAEFDGGGYVPSAEKPGFYRGHATIRENFTYESADRPPTWPLWLVGGAIVCGLLLRGRR